MEKDANEGIEAFVNKRDPHWFVKSSESVWYY